MKTNQWKLRGDFVIVNGRNEVVAKVTDSKLDHADKLANARLIAIAPALLEALLDVANADYGTDTPKLRKRALTAIALFRDVVLKP